MVFNHFLTIEVFKKLVLKINLGSITFQKLIMELSCLLLFSKFYKRTELAANDCWGYIFLMYVYIFPEEASEK